MAAKAVGMRVTKFYVGFPPAVVKRVVGGTEYGIGLIPLGGFVRIVGMGRPRGKDLHACSEAAVTRMSSSVSSAFCRSPRSR